MRTTFRRYDTQSLLDNQVFDLVRMEMHKVKRIYYKQITCHTYFELSEPA